MPAPGPLSIVGLGQFGIRVGQHVTQLLFPTLTTANQQKRDLHVIPLY